MKFIILLGLMQMLLIAQHINAFCIYNHSQKTANVRQRSYNTGGDVGSLFDKTMAFNSTECCPLDQSTCCKSGNAEEELRINFVISDVRYGINFPAGGWVDIVDWGSGIDFIAYNKDGSDYKYQTFEVSAVNY